MSVTDDERRIRSIAEKLFGAAEDVLYLLIALALTAAGFVYLGYTIYDFFHHLKDETLTPLVLNLLDGLLLVFIITEIIHTIRAVIAEKVLVSEPFLVVGVVAAIRRLIVVSAEAKDLFGTPDFGDAMLEISVLTGAVVFLGLTIFMLRHTHQSEPRPEHEPGS
jgi:uncharacterized membrane protein (DUF373 family)